MPATADDRIAGISTSVAVKAPVITVATSNITLSGLQTINGVTVTENERVLVTAQTSSIDNGIYTVSTGSWSRSKDFDGNRDVVQGTRVLVAKPGASTAQEYELTTANPITIGSSALSFSLRYSANATYVRTAAEISALVVPVDTTFIPGNPRRQGAPIDGVTSARTAFFNQNATGEMQYWTRGTYLIDSALTITSPVYCESGVTIKLVNADLTFNNGAGFAGAAAPIFSYTGTGRVKGLRDAYAEWFGASSANSASVNAGFISAAAAAVANASTGGLVRVTPGIYLSANTNDLVIPATVNILLYGRASHQYQFSGDTDCEFGFMGPQTFGTGSSNPTVRIHNHSPDGKQIPTLMFSAGPIENSNTALIWAIQGTNFGNANPYTNVQACDLVIAGGQGSSYTTGTADVVAGSATVTGHGTSWSSDYIGAVLTIGTQNACGIVKSVESTTSLTLANIWSTYGGSTASGQVYHLQGGRWFGSATSDYRSRLTLAQNYTWLFNSGNCSTGDYDPLAIANGGGSYAQNLTAVFNGNRLKGGAINPSTIIKIDSGSASNGFCGFVFRSSDFAGAPTKSIALLKSTNEIQIGNGTDVTPHIRITSTGMHIDASGGNGHFAVHSLKVFANNAAALAGGLVEGDFYKTAAAGDAHVMVTNAT